MAVYISSADLVQRYIGAMGIPVHVGLHSVVDKQTRVGCSFNYAAPFYQGSACY